MGIENPSALRGWRVFLLDAQREDLAARQSDRTRVSTDAKPKVKNAVAFRKTDLLRRIEGEEKQCRNVAGSSGSKQTKSPTSSATDRAPVVASLTSPIMEQQLNCRQMGTVCGAGSSS